ncbi:hypothetical protein LWI29_027146 [Acer saccharum]|uniref:Uncharacterized protein n=1 Tax=Acer saccharum TaxID=4024 RepID=A0AA39RR79_ACESA|nr:hypothetical protein LWI29_027146 [Acer saccharum]
MKFIRSGELYRLINNATKTVWNKLPSRSIKFADTLCFAIGGDSVGMAVADISLEKTYAFTVLNQTCYLGSFTKHLEKHMMGYKFGHFVIGYAVPDSDEKPPEHIEKLLLGMDKAPALKHILYTEFDERGTSKRGAKRRSEVHAIVDRAYNSTEKKKMASAMCILDDFLEMKTKDNQSPFSRYTIDKIKREETEEVEEGETGTDEGEKVS